MIGYQKVNVNPKGRFVGDCVIRAISTAMDISWDNVYKDLCEIGLKEKRMPNDKKVFHKYLEKNGWVKCKQPKYFDKTKYVVKDLDLYLGKDRVEETLIISVAKHLTVIKSGSVVDTWDCRGKKVGNYWKRP